MNIEFLIELSRRRLNERYIGSSSKILWIVISPIVPLLMILIVFFYIAKIPDVMNMGLADYSVFVFSGLIPFRFIQKATSEGCELLVANMDMLKSAIFPLPILSMSAIGAMAFDLLMQISLLITLVIIAGTSLQINLLLFLPAILLLFIFSLGLSWIFSVIGAFAREISEIVLILFGALIYFTPIIYPITATPSIFQTFVLLNPLTHFVLIFRDCLEINQSPSHISWFVVSILATVSFLIGRLCIEKAKNYVGDMV